MVRSFSEQPVALEAVEGILELAHRAPSAGNTTGRSHVVLNGPAETSLYWQATTTPDWRARSRRYPALSRAPVVVVVMVDPSRYTDRYDEADKSSSGLGTSSGGVTAWPVPFWHFDAGAAVMSMLLGATAAGLGACFLGNFRGEERLFEALGVPPSQSWRFVGAVLLGHPDGADPVSSSVARGRPALSDVVHRGRWNDR
jgi:nitroreductase